MEQDLARGLASLARELSATAKALRLYPPTSPIPHSAAESAAQALDALFDQVPLVSFQITREGLSFAGAPIEGSPTIKDLASAFQSHGIAEFSFTPGCDTDQLVSLLVAITEEPEALREEGGLAARLAAQNADYISVSDVHLTVVDGMLPDDADVDEFLRDLAGDPAKLATWLSSAAAGDPGILRDSLLDLARSAGDDGRRALMANLANAFVAQQPESKDALMTIAMDEGPVRELAQEMFTNIGAGDVAESVCGGVYGKNMLSLSTAMTNLPIGERFASVMASVQEMLPEYGHDSHELDFLEHMIETRKSATSEPALSTSDPDYGRVALQSTVDESELASARSEAEQADVVARRRTVTTLLALLDQQKDFNLYVQTLDSLASTIPRLIEGGDLPLAEKALFEIADRETATDHPWPELAEKLREARGKATGERAMIALLAAVKSDKSVVADARELLNSSGEEAPLLLLEQALGSREDDSLDMAEAVLGRRMIDLLPRLSSKAKWFNAAKLSRKLVDSGDPRLVGAVNDMAKNPDEQMRREVAKGLAGSKNPAALSPLTVLLADESPQVTIVAARALAGSELTGAARAVADRLDALDIDNKDFALARELIIALERSNDPVADWTLEHLANRKAFIKRGHFVEVQTLARKVLSEKGGASS